MKKEPVDVEVTSTYRARYTWEAYRGDDSELRASGSANSILSLRVQLLFLVVRDRLGLIR